MAFESTNTIDTTNLGSAVSIREQLMKGASLITPTLSPMLSTLDKVNSTSLKYDFSIDDLDDVDTTPTAEGASGGNGGDAFDQLGRYQNILTKKRKEFSVTRESQMVDSAVEIKYNAALFKKTQELNRDCEAIIMGTQAKAIGAKGSPNYTAGLGEQLSGSSTIFDTEYQTPAAQVVSSGSPTEQSVNVIIDSIFNESGETQNLRIYADTAWQRAFAESTVRLAGTPTNNKLNVNINGETGTVPMFVRVFEGQHGMVTLFDTNPKCSTDPTNLDTAYFINPDYVCIAEMGGVFTFEDAPTAGNRYGGVERIFAPIVKNPRACAFQSAI